MAFGHSPLLRTTETVLPLCGFLRTLHGDLPLLRGLLRRLLRSLLGYLLRSRLLFRALRGDFLRRDLLSSHCHCKGPFLLFTCSVVPMHHLMCAICSHRKRKISLSSIEHFDTSCLASSLEREHAHGHRACTHVPDDRGDRQLHRSCKIRSTTACVNEED